VVLERMTRLHPKLIDMSLDRVWRLLADLDNPQDRLPPVIHVAGTNGKGSTVATMRAVLEAAGYTVHVYTSPHLVRFAERIRLAGALIDEELLTQLLEHVEEVNAGRPITFFEVTTIAALLAFARVPADVCLLETGMGGRLDATNVVKRPLVTVLTSISMDHMQFLGDTLGKIAAEKAEIMRAGVPCVSVAQADEAAAVIAAAATRIGADLKLQDRDWRVTPTEGGSLRFVGRDVVWTVPQPSLPGRHQFQNAGAALAALEHSRLAIPLFALKSGLRHIDWPARGQRLTRGPLVGALPAGWELWLDGGHNAGCGEALAQLAAEQWAGTPLHLIAGMLSTKAADDFLRPLQPHITSFTAVPVPDNATSFAPGDLTAAARRVGFATVQEAPDVATALARVTAEQGPRARVLICGSLYLAGDVLRDNG
jgi:dihydrofolate synthase/folylpolyglutamate synthase